MTVARPTKTGLDYYPMDVGFLRDKKVRLLRSEFGPSSVLFVLYVLGKVYEGDGYFLAWDKDELLLAADELRETPTYISEVLKGCLSRSLFDERVFQMFSVLTSAGIQRRYLRGCEKRDVITVFSEYWLLNECSKTDVPAGVRAKLALVSVSGGNNPVNSPGNSDNPPGNPESKVKESKVKQLPKGSCIRTRATEGSGIIQHPTFEQVLEYAKFRGAEQCARPFFDYYSAANWRDSQNIPVYNWQQKFIAWQMREEQRQKKDGGKRAGKGAFDAQPTREQIQHHNDWIDAFLAEQREKEGE